MQEYSRTLSSDILDNTLNAQITADELLPGLCSETTLHVTSQNVLDAQEAKSSIKSIQTLLQKFWNLEHIGIEQIKEDVYSHEEHEALELMKKISYYDPDKQRWFTSLLWKKDRQNLGCNYQRCLSVMMSVEKGAASKNTGHMITDFFNELLINNFAEKVTSSTPSQRTTGSKHFIPCHAVYRFDRESTKCRMVMNCSSKTETGFSLNDLLYTGPLLLPDYVKILIQFRLHAIAFTTDISKMFLQIGLSDEGEMDLLRFLWRDADLLHDPVEYRMRVLVFGAVSSPFQAIWCVKEHARINGSPFPAAQRLVGENLYMDDVASSVASHANAVTAVAQLDALFSLASMETHKWASNDHQVLANFSADRKATPGRIKVFGQSWDTVDDKLLFKFCELEPVEAGGLDTKRTFLKKSASVFDPIGLLAPFTLAIKLLFQILWVQKLDWDDKLPEDLQKTWTAFKVQIPLLSEVAIHRPLTNSTTRKDARIVVFCDSSLKAYAACAYLVVQYVDGTSSSRLVVAKTRVAPVKILDKVEQQDQMTIVRLELLSMLIGARLCKYVRDTIDQRIQLSEAILFSDSMINLCRLRKGFNNYGCWVAARLREVTELTSVSSWGHVPTDHNPADIGSRGITNISHLIKEKMWWEGPSFLQEMDPEEWKNISPIKGKENLEDLEIRKEIKQIFTIQEIKYESVLTKFSSWEKTVRVLSYALRFTNCHHRPFRTTVIGAVEFGTTERTIFKVIQGRWKKDFDALEKGIRLPQESQLKNLTVFKDKDGIMRHQSRLESSRHLTYDEKYPIILPDHDQLVEKYVLHVHQIHVHAGLNAMLGIVRNRFLILKGRREVKRIIGKCKTLKCVKPKPLGQIMAPLPKERIDDMVAFQNIAVDLFGPLYVKKYSVEQTNKQEKVYGCIFTCLMSRAIHLELMYGMSTEEFLKAFQLMCSRKGTPTTIFSDQGKYFQMADRELNRLYKAVNWERVAQTTASRKIEWIFNAPSAPWQTGIVERMVQSTKKPLRTVLGNAKVTARNLQVILADIEAMINNRPLAVINEDTYLPITPAELIFGRKMDGLPMQTKMNAGMSFPEMWKKRKNLNLAFWKQWKNDYLLKQSVRQKWNEPYEKDLLGQIVIINDDNLMKNEWKMGRIIACYKGRNDNRVRSVDVKLASGIIRRPLQRLALLEGAQE